MLHRFLPNKAKTISFLTKTHSNAPSVSFEAARTTKKNKQTTESTTLAILFKTEAIEIRKKTIQCIIKITL